MTSGPAADGPILQIRDLSIGLPVKADRAFAVKDVSLSLSRNEILCIVGESGSGKSVMTSAIMNNIPPGLTITKGEVIFNGQDVLKLSEAELREMRGARIAMIYQEPMAALNPSMRVGRQVEEVFQFHRPEISAEQRRDETLILFEQMQLPAPSRIYESFPHQISGGQCQRVVIAMALACKPEILIADEPTTALDVTTQRQILSLINELKGVYDNGTIFITHDFGVVADIADRVAVMCWGEVVEEGPAEQVLMHPREDYTKLLVDAMPALETTREPETTRNDPPVIEAHALSKVYKTGNKEVRALDGASFQLKRGETLAVVGESGSGKSTLAKALIRLTEPTSGTVVIHERDFLQLKGADLQKRRREIQMIFQDPFGSLNPSHRVGAILKRGPMLMGMTAEEAEQRARELLQLVGLSADAYRRFPRNFSGGQRQRIGIARALSMDPDVVIADESISALDLTVQKQVLRLMNDLQRKLDNAIIFITHDLRVAAQISDYITVMERGVMVEFGTAEQVFNAPKHEYTKKLLDAAPGRDWHPPRLDGDEAERIIADTARAKNGTSPSY
ncbi:MAG: ABC transporter ATP-binding protein [Pseudomonadota bacterium]